MDIGVDRFIFNGDKFFQFFGHPRILEKLLFPLLAAK